MTPDAALNIVLGGHGAICKAGFAPCKRCEREHEATEVLRKFITDSKQACQSAPVQTEAEWAVEVLDAWARLGRGVQLSTGWSAELAAEFKHLDQGDARIQLQENGEGTRAFWGPTPTAARISAARALAAQDKTLPQFKESTDGE